MSSIDFTTNANIHTTIREEFNDSLLLTGKPLLPQFFVLSDPIPAAHHLCTVINYDRLIISDKRHVSALMGTCISA